jgi:hypothetical protein
MKQPTTLAPGVWLIPDEGYCFTYRINKVRKGVGCVSVWCDRYDIDPETRTPVLKNCHLGYGVTLRRVSETQWIECHANRPTLEDEEVYARDYDDGRTFTTYAYGQQEMCFEEAI